MYGKTRAQKTAAGFKVNKGKRRRQNFDIENTSAVSNGANIISRNHNFQHDPENCKVNKNLFTKIQCPEIDSKKGAAPRTCQTKLSKKCQKRKFSSRWPKKARLKVQEEPDLNYLHKNSAVILKRTRPPSSRTIHQTRSHAKIYINVAFNRTSSVDPAELWFSNRYYCFSCVKNRKLSFEGQYTKIFRVLIQKSSSPGPGEDEKAIFTLFSNAHLRDFDNAQDKSKPNHRKLITRAKDRAANRSDHPQRLQTTE